MPPKRGPKLYQPVEPIEAMQVKAPYKDVINWCHGTPLRSSHGLTAKIIGIKVVDSDGYNSIAYLDDYIIRDTVDPTRFTVYRKDLFESNFRQVRKRGWYNEDG